MNGNDQEGGQPIGRAGTVIIATVVSVLFGSGSAVAIRSYDDGPTPWWVATVEVERQMMINSMHKVGQLEARLRQLEQRLTDHQLRHIDPAVRYDNLAADDLDD